MNAHVSCGTRNSGEDSTVLPIQNGHLVAAMRVHHATLMRLSVIKTSELVLGNRLGAVSTRELLLNATISSIVKRSSRVMLMSATIREVR